MSSILQREWSGKFRLFQRFPITTNTNPRMAAITNEYLALSIAVKKLEAKILNPFAKNAKPIIFEPPLAISATAGLESFRNNDITVSPNPHKRIRNKVPIMKFPRTTSFITSPILFHNPAP